jgi:hypothetical protein
MSRHFYTDADVERWENVEKNSLQIHNDKLATDLPQRLVDHHLSGLSATFWSRAMICIAKGEFGKAIEALRTSTEYRCKVYERFEKGDGTWPPDAGDFQTLLVALVSRDEASIARFVSLYRYDKGTPGSVFLGRAVKLLVMNEIDAARESLGQKKPRFEPQFVGYAECFEAMANKDEHGFVAALTLASKKWAKVVSIRDRGLPYSVCFIQGAGLVRLAEKVLGKPISVSNEHIPPQLFR